MQLMQNFLLRLNVFPPFNGLMERRLAIYTTRTPVETFTSPCVGLIIISLFSITVNYNKPCQRLYIVAFCNNLRQFFYSFIQCIAHVIYLFFIMRSRNSESNSAFTNRNCRWTNSGPNNTILI